MIKISYIKSDERQYNVERCLALIKSEITQQIKLAKRVVIKIDASRDNNPGAVTNSSTLDSILKCITPFVTGQITLVEGVKNGDTLTAFKNYNYLSLQSRYDLAIVDLNTDDYLPIMLTDKDGRTFDAKVSKTLLESDYLISVSLPKTHSKILYTGAIHNIAGSAVVAERSSWLRRLLSNVDDGSGIVYQDQAIATKNIIKLYEKLTPKLSIIDCFETVQGDGDIRGDNVHTHFAIASTNAVAADYLAAKSLGFEVDDIGYLSTLSLETNDIFVIGDDYEKHKYSIKMPSNYKKLDNINSSSI
ncbi:MAG: DUF362 domain-containing protein [Candidatus Berkelbacteria bacterium]